MTKTKNLILSICTFLFACLAVFGICILSTGCGETPSTPPPPDTVSVNFYIVGGQRSNQTYAVEKANTLIYNYGQELGDAVYTPAAPKNLVFDGWYSDEACEHKVELNTTLTADTNLYGHWRYDDQRNWYAIGAGQGTLSESNWEHEKLNFVKDAANSTTEMTVFTLELDLYNGDQFKVTHDGAWDDALGRGDVWVGWEDFVDEDPDKNIVLKERHNNGAYAEGTYVVKLYTYWHPNGNDIKNHLEITFTGALEHKEKATYTITVTPVGYTGTKYQFEEKQYTVQIGDTWSTDSIKSDFSLNDETLKQLWSVQLFEVGGEDLLWAENWWDNYSVRVFENMNLELRFTGREIEVVWTVEHLGHHMSELDHTDTVRVGTTITEFQPDPSQYGVSSYSGITDFNGWYIGTSDNHSQDKFDFSKPIEEGVVAGSLEFYGWWLNPKVTVVWNIDNGNGANEDHTDMYRVYQQITEFHPDPSDYGHEEDGYTFDGWYTDSDYQKKFDFNTYINTPVITEQDNTLKVILYGRWVPAD